MTKSKRTLLIEELYKGEIHSHAYEEYIGSDTTPHIRTFLILNDEFNTTIKLEELGVSTSSLIEDLKKDGYKPLNELSTLKLKK